MITGGILLLVDAFLWTGVLLIGKGINTNTWYTWLELMLGPFAFLFGFPFIFIGVLFVLIGLALSLKRDQSVSLLRIISGSLSIVVSIPAFGLGFMSCGGGGLAWALG